MIKHGRLGAFAAILAIAVTTPTQTEPAAAAEEQGLKKYRLPQWETPYEQALTAIYGRPPSRGPLTAPPTGTVLAPAEFGHQDGILLVFDSGWGHIYRPMIAEIQAAGAIAYIVVESTNEKNQVLNHLDAYGIPTDMVEFVIVNIDTVWIRDYGPFTILAEGLGGIVDADYSRSWRVNDDLFPGRLAGPTMWDMDHYGMGMVLDGGNFMSDGCGTCMVTDEVFNWNPSMSEAEITANLEDYLGCERVVYLLHQLNDGTGHIDMFAKFLDSETILLAQFQPGDTNYERLEDNAATLAAMETCTGGSYDIVRIDTEYGFRTYTNSQFVNDTILVPIWGLAYDGTALAIYEDAMPGYNVIGINVASMAGTGGAIHCIARELPESPEPDVNPEILDFGETEILLSFEIANAGPGEISWTAAGTEPWIIAVNPTSGTTTTETDLVEVSVDRSGLAAGTHFGAIEIDTGNGNREITVRIIAGEPVCTDDDGDGYALEGGLCGDVDCDDADAEVNPGHVEVPGNGIDDDCDGEIDEGGSCFIGAAI